MKKRKFSHIWIPLLIMSLLNCKDKAEDMGSCFPGKAIKSVKNQKGRIHYNTDEKKYAVYVSIPGTYDSVDAGFICDRADTLKTEGLLITFDGDYLPYESNRKATFVGMEYYNLNITNFTIDK